MYDDVLRPTWSEGALQAQLHLPRDLQVLHPVLDVRRETDFYCVALSRADEVHLRLALVDIIVNSSSATAGGGDLMSWSLLFDGEAL